MVQKKKGRASFMSSKKATLFKSKPKRASAPTMSDHLEMVRTFSGFATNAPPTPIIHPASVSHLSSSSALAVGTFEAFFNHEIEEALERVDPRMWGTCQDVFEKSLFVEKLEELHALSYNDLEKNMILLMQEVFHAQLLFFTLNLAIPEPIFFAVHTLCG